jgi:hypothetical protein
VGLGPRLETRAALEEQHGQGEPARTCHPPGA